MPWKGANWLLKQHSPSASHSPVSKPLHSGKAGQGPDVALALDSPFFFSWDHFLFSRGWHKGKAEVPWRLHSEASPPTEEKLWPICGLLSCQEEAPSREIGLFFFLSPDSRWQLCKAAQSWRQLVQVPILWDWESETSPPRKRGTQPRVEVWPCGPGQRVAIPAKTSWTTKLGESPGMGSFGEQ